MYLLWSATMGGWLTQSATYTTSLSDARRFDASEARRIVLRHRGQDALGMIPVRIEEIMMELLK